MLDGEEGNDVILPGPDIPNFGQSAAGGQGNDAIFVFAGEISACLAVFGNAGSDSANFIGFGPYSLQKPFGLPDDADGWFHIVDPIAGWRYRHSDR